MSNIDSKQHELMIKIIENLPKCYNCSNIATRYGAYEEYNKIGEYYYTNEKFACDNCNTYMSELSYASSLREYLFHSKRKL